MAGVSLLLSDYAYCPLGRVRGWYTVTPAQAGVQDDWVICAYAIVPVTPAQAGVQVRCRLDSGVRRNDG